jgi:hypothetical protein
MTKSKPRKKNKRRRRPSTLNEVLLATKQFRWALTKCEHSAPARAWLRLWFTDAEIKGIRDGLAQIDLNADTMLKRRTRPTPRPRKRNH